MYGIFTKQIGRHEESRAEDKYNLKLIIICPTGKKGRFHDFDFWVCFCEFFCVALFDSDTKNVLHSIFF